MRLLLWHVHGSYTNALVQGGHDYHLPVVAGRGPEGRGRARTWDWPPNVREVTRAEARDLELDAVILQRPEELEQACEGWTGRRPGRDLPAVYLEHNAPQGRIADLGHPAADRPDLRLVHVTHFNDLFWDAGTTPTTVIEHGVVDPGHRYTGERPRAAVVVNEPRRRGRVTGTDLLPRFAAHVDLDLFGMGAPAVASRLGPAGTTHDDLPQHELHAVLGERRLYLHTMRWTSLGLSLLEAMHLGMPVVALATTEAADAVPTDAGVVSNRFETLTAAIHRFLREPDDAQLTGKRAREAALARYGLDRFLADWDVLLKEVAA